MKSSVGSIGQSVTLGLPFRDAWTAFIAPADPNGGAGGAFGRLLARATGHRHAFDFVGLNESLEHRRSGTLRHFAGKAEDHYAWSRTVLAPFDAEVIVARDGWADRKRTGLIPAAGMLLSRPKVRAEDLRPAAGNHVLIRSGAVVAFLAHLRCGSVRVRESQRVGSGQPVGEVGNSGTSYAPHLHLQLLDGANPLTAKGIPIRFRHYERWNGGSWEPVRDGVPRRLEPVRPAPGTVA